MLFCLTEYKMGFWIGMTFKNKKKNRETYARSVINNSSDKNVKKRPGNGVPCRNWQSGLCGFPANGSHDINGLYVKHVCAY